VIGIQCGKLLGFQLDGLLNRFIRQGGKIESADRDFLA